MTDSTTFDPRNVTRLAPAKKWRNLYRAMIECQAPGAPVRAEGSKFYGNHTHPSKEIAEVKGQRYAALNHPFVAWLKAEEVP